MFQTTLIRSLDYFALNLGFCFLQLNLFRLSSLTILIQIYTKSCRLCSYKSKNYIIYKIVLLCEVIWQDDGEGQIHIKVRNFFRPSRHLQEINAIKTVVYPNLDELQSEISEDEFFVSFAWARSQLSPRCQGKALKNSFLAKNKLVPSLFPAWLKLWPMDTFGPILVLVLDIL